MEKNENKMEHEWVVELDNVVISYDDEPVLKDVDLRLGKGDFAYLIGKSGAGKTSLLRSLYADQPIESGVARVCGFDVVNIRRRHVPQLRRKIGIVFQNFRLLNDRSVYSNLEFVLRATGWKKRNEIKNQIDKVLASVGIADKADVLPTRLSEGEQQRVGIARAIINTPQLILADEPTGNLDTATSEEVMKLFAAIHRKGNTVILVTHEEDIARHAGRIVYLRDGKIERDENLHENR